MSGMQWSFGFSCLFFLKTVWICQAFDADTPDPRVLSLDLTLVCSDDKSKQATLISYPVTFKGHVIKDMQIFCKNGWMQMTRGRGINMIRIHYPQTYTSVVPGACVFRGPYSIPTNDSIETYNVSVALLWSDGTPTYESLECNVTKSQASNAPEPKASPTSSTPEPEATSHNQSKLIDWDVFCSQNENIPAKFISRLVAPKCLAVEKMNIDCSNGLVPITHEHGFNTMLIQYTRNKLLDSPGMCVFWGPYSVPKNDTVVLYTVTARLKWSEGPPTNLLIECYMPKSPDAPKPESCLSSPPEPDASSTSNAAEPEAGHESSAPEKVYSDQPAPSHNQSKLINWDIYCSQNESIPAKFISRIVTSKDQALEKTELNCSNGLVPITQELGINMMLIQYTRNELLDSPGMCVFWGPYSVPKNDTVVLYTVTARLKWSEGPPTNLSIECYMPKSPVAPKPETGPTSSPPEPEASPTSNAPEPETYPTSSAPGTSPEGSATAAPGTSPEGNTTAARNADPRKSNQTTATEVVLGDTSNYIIKVIPHCKTRGDVALIEIITDVDLSAVAVCSNGSRHHFNSTDFVHFYLPVSYNVTPSVCSFTRSKANLFKLHIGVSWKDRLHDVTTHKKDFLITCTFDPHKSHRGPTSASSEPLIAAKEIQSHQGPQSDAEEVFLKLVDIRNETLAAAVPLSKKVRLVGEVRGSSLDSGLKPVACDAVGVQQGQRYAILRAGCGDGIVFAKDIGFITEGNKTFSPVFEVFKLHGNLHLTFMCNFTLCTHSCDGSSCSNQRRKRRSMAWQDIPHVADFDSSAIPSTDMATVQVALLVAVALLITQLAGLAIYVNIN